MDRIALLRGIGLTVVAGVLFASMDALGKELSTLTSVLQVVWGRYLFQSLIMAAILHRQSGTAFLRPRRPLLQLVRGATLLGATMLMYTALSQVPLADATATLFLGPILVTVFSVIFLHERIGRHRIAAVVMGFVGVLLILRPGSASVDPALFLALAASVCNASYLLLTRAAAVGDEPAATQFFTTAPGAILLSLAVVPLWESPTPAVFALLVAIGGIGTAGHYALVSAFAHAPASLLSPFLYSQVLFAGVLSLALFGDPLHPAMLAGTAILVASGLYIWWRENRGPSLQPGNASRAVSPPSET